MITKQNIIDLFLLHSTGIEHPTDKASYHAHEHFYPDVLINFLDRPINILEIGVANGASILLWSKIFPQATIYGADRTFDFLKHPVTSIGSVNLLRAGDQTDPLIYENLPSLDIVIDDASHDASKSMCTYNILKNKLKKNSIYVIEDVYEEQLPEYEKEFLSQFKMVDLRKIKNRGDDILLVRRSE